MPKPIFRALNWHLFHYLMVIPVLVRINEINLAFLNIEYDRKGVESIKKSKNTFHMALIML